MLNTVGVSPFVALARFGAPGVRVETPPLGVVGVVDVKRKC